MGDMSAVSKILSFQKFISFKKFISGFPESWLFNPIICDAILQCIPLLISTF